MRTWTLLAMVVCGCGGDPLIGAWRSQDVGSFGMYSDNVSQLITFSAGNKVTSQGRVTYKAGLPIYAGCQESTNATGVYALSGAAGDQSLVFTYDGGTISREMCATPADNLSSRAFNADELKAVNNSGGKFVLSGNTFRVTDGGNQTYTFTKQ